MCWDGACGGSGYDVALLSGKQGKRQERKERRQWPRRTSEAPNVRVRNAGGLRGGTPSANARSWTPAPHTHLGLPSSDLRPARKALSHLLRDSRWETDRTCRARDLPLPGAPAPKGGLLETREWIHTAVDRAFGIAFSPQPRCSNEFSERPRAS